MKPVNNVSAVSIYLRKDKGQTTGNNKFYFYFVLNVFCYALVSLYEAITVL